MPRARRVERKPGEVRRSLPVDPEKVERLHSQIGSVRIEHGDPDDMDSPVLRAQFFKVREGRNKVQRIFSKLAPRLGQLRADLARLEAFIAAESAELSLPTNAALDGCRNEAQRKAKLRDYLREWHEVKDEVRADLALVEAVMAHAKYVREELRYAFEEASRALSSIELEHRFER